MAARMVKWALEVRPLHRSQKGVLVALADMANGDGQCWPSHDRLAERAGLSASTVARALKGLADAKLIEVEPQRLADGTRQTSLITVFPLGRPDPALPHSAIVAGGEMAGAEMAEP